MCNVKNDECDWVSADVLKHYTDAGWKIKENLSRMSYAEPAWVPKDPEEKVILLLDDYSRAAPHFINATMELIDRGEYLSWKLPKNCNIVLSSNPDNGDYNVSTLDNAWILVV